ncbi:NAD(P)-binding protein [Rhizoclosmatium globosum]|uniref:NAD(P)-binding protein n=1 Tax=Rhizoclosmatium globosum TaxID=329046 RepID=A0A1Y2D3F4_9FUNG|nr:NAD(P)-binding protein [Rhizoclosmatium globosum]|eukprot:ORY53829.1 NAD(P)-binding protein [Rhizoclosmatium globosum]
MASESLNLTAPALFGLQTANTRKVAIVTGGGTGIGKMITAALAQNGAKVYIASRKLKVVQDAAAEINAMPNTIASKGEVIALQADLVDKEKCVAFVNQIKAKEQKLHILVNNAGISWGSDLLDFDEKNGWDKLMAVNVPGRVINISSIASYIPGSADPGGSGTYSYNASKAAVNHLTRILAASFAERKVTVNCIAPGFYPSRMTQHGLAALGDAAAIGHPMGRIGSTEDMAGLALFLSSRASAHITVK